MNPNPVRLELACQLGATEGLSPNDRDAVSAIHRPTGGGVDLAIESVGKADIVRQAFDAPATRGRVIAVDLTGFAEEVSIPIMSLLFDKSLRGSSHGSADPVRDFPKLFRLAAQGELVVEAMIGPDYPLEEVNDAFEASASGSAIRPRIIFD